MSNTLMSPFQSITEQEHRVLMLLREAQSNKEIAFELGISKHTVRAHVRSLMQKFGAPNRTGLAVIAIHIDPDSSSIVAAPWEANLTQLQQVVAQVQDTLNVHARLLVQLQSQIGPASGVEEHATQEPAVLYRTR